MTRSKLTASSPAGTSSVAAGEPASESAKIRERINMGNLFAHVYSAVLRTALSGSGAFRAGQFNRWGVRRIEGFEGEFFVCGVESDQDRRPCVELAEQHTLRERVFEEPLD